MSEEREVLVVASKVKARFKELGLKTSKEAIEAISDRVYDLIDLATAKALGDKRKTVKGRDFLVEKPVAESD